MIKLYKDLTDYAKQNKICRQTASTRFKKGDLNIIKIPEGMKYMEINGDKVY